MGWAAVLVLFCGEVVAQAPDTPPGEPVETSAQPPDPAETPSDPAPSPWYLKRGTELRLPGAADDVPRVLKPLVELMRDGQVPGFFDGQFGDLAGDFDELARLAKDETMEHTLRLMAVMALQEAGDGERLAAQLEPLLLSVAEEFNAELNEWADFGSTVEEGFVRRILRADLSRHVRFALAKDGQSAPVLAKIEVMYQYIWKHRVDILDPSIKSDVDFLVAHKRSIWFDIAYHYQQFDDYETAAHWFRQLTQNLSPNDTWMAHYNLACIAALQGRPEEAVQELELAVSGGFQDVEWMDEDADLESLRERPDYQELRRRLRNGDGLPGLTPTFAPPDPESGASPSDTGG